MNQQVVPVFAQARQNLTRLLFLSLFAAMPASAADSGHKHSVRAAAFSNPTRLATVPAGWQARPIKYFAAHKDADLVVALGQQSYPIFKNLIADYAKKNKLKIVVKSGTCGITAGRLLRKTVDIGAYCCPPGKTDRLPGLEFHSLGISPIALIVHPDNPLTNISKKQARQIFQGLVSRWSEVAPGQTKAFNKPIQPVGRLHCKVRPGHWRLLLKNEDLFSARLFEVGVIPDMMSRVSRNPRAIGYEVPLMVKYHQSKGKVKMLKINGHEPGDTAYMLSGQYPLYRVYHLVTWKQDNKTNRQARTLVRFLQSYIENHYQEIGYIPPSQLKKAGWKFRRNELIGEPVHGRRR